MIGPASLGVRAVQLREGCARGTGFSRPTFNNGVQHPQKVAASRFCVGFDLLRSGIHGPAMTGAKNSNDGLSSDAAV